MNTGIPLRFRAERGLHVSSTRAVVVGDFKFLLCTRSREDYRYSVLRPTLARGPKSHESTSVFPFQFRKRARPTLRRRRRALAATERTAAAVAGGDERAREIIVF